MILMFFDDEQWHIARMVQKSGFGIDIAGYCGSDGNGKIEQLPERVLEKIHVCDKCTAAMGELG